MLQFLQETPPEAYDAILMSFSIHHLTTVQKEEFLRLCSARLAKKGRLIVVDIFRRNGQAIEDYLQCYVADMRDHWASLDAADLELATHHVRNFDLPETLDDFLALARKAGLVLESPPLQYGYHALAILSSPP
jgi:ubiquinone/menaquinone biosynthesis C-methylase UbiE